MPYTVCVCHRQSVSVTDSLCLSQTICVCHRQSLFVKDSLCLSQTFCFCHRHSVSVTDSLFLSQTIYDCHRQLLSVTIFFVSQSKYVSVRDSMCLSQLVCVFPRHFAFCHRQSVFVTASLCLSKQVVVRQSLSLSILFIIILGLTFTYLYMIFIKICLWDFSLSGISIHSIPTLWTPGHGPPWPPVWYHPDYLEAGGSGHGSARRSSA